MMLLRKRFILSVAAILLSTTSPAKDGSKMNSEAGLESSPSSINYLQLSGTLEGDETPEQIRIYPRNSNHMAYFLVKLEDINSIKNILGKELEIDSSTVDRNEIFFINIRVNSKGQGIELDEYGNVLNKTEIIIDKAYPLSFLMKAYPLDFPTSNASNTVTQRSVNCHFSSVCKSNTVCCSAISGLCQCFGLQ